MPIRDKAKHNEYMKNYRKTHKDAIDKNLRKRVEKLKSEKSQEQKPVTQKPRIKRPLTIFDDKWGRDPIENPEKSPQVHDPQNRELLGANAWGQGSTTQEEPRPKPKSNQDILRDAFPEFSE